MGALLVLARLVQLSQRTFYWDDLIIPARYSPLNFATLFQLHDGHLMPGSVLVQVGMHQLAPLQWWPVAAIITILTAASFAAWVPVLRRLAPQSSSGQLLALAALGFSPFLMDAAGWWSAALNAYAWQLAAAATLYALLTRRYRWAAAALLAGLFFTEKAFTIVPVVLVALWLRKHIGRPVPHPRTLLPLVAVFAAWLALFITLSLHQPRPATDVALLRGIPTALRDAIIPGTLGGPWTWTRWVPAKAFADPHPVAWALALIVFCALLAYLIKRGAALPLAASAVFLALVFVLLLQARDGANTSDLLLRSMHYYSDWWTGTVLFIAAASGLKIGRALTVVFIISALISTITWTWAWRDDPARDYLATLHHTNTDGLLEQPTPLHILLPLTHPHNTIAAITGNPASPATTEPRIVDESGRLVPAAVLPAARTAQGDEPGCGNRIRAGESVIITIDNPLPFGEWTWEMNAAATGPMELRLTTPNGLEDSRDTAARATTITVGPDLAQRWVRLSGGGGLIKIDAKSSSPTDSICIGAGAIGPLVMAE